MIYKRPRYRLAGEQHLLVELGDEINLTINCKMIAFAERILHSPELGSQGIHAILDVVPSFTTVLIQYDPHVITLQGLIRFCDCCLQQLEGSQDLALMSRLIEIPVAYNDRWSRACFEQYCQTIKPVEDNPEFVARLNGFSSLDDLITHHTTPEWWVGAVGFMAGLPTLMPLDPKFRLHAPKYDPPRVWTPKGTIGVGGGFTTIYPIVVPDGYQMIGRTPLAIFEPEQRFTPFQNTPFLFSIGDRVKFRSISESEFEEIEEAVAVGNYQYQISEPRPFRLNDYLQPLQRSIA
jgi:urea carboxylase